MSLGFFKKKSFWKTCSRCKAGLIKAEHMKPHPRGTPLATSIFYCQNCGAATCSECYHLDHASCKNCGESDIVTRIEVIPGWKELK